MVNKNRGTNMRDAVTIAVAKGIKAAVTKDCSGRLESGIHKVDTWVRVQGSITKGLDYEQVQHMKFETRDQARAAIFEFIEIFYNRRRLHSSLGYRTPLTFEREFCEEPAA